MSGIELSPIGHVRSRNTLNTPDVELQASTSEVVIDERFADGLMGLEKNELIIVVFYFDKAYGTVLCCTPGATCPGPSRAFSTHEVSSVRTRSA